MSNLIKIPTSLGDVPATSTPLYLELKYELTKNTKKWRRIKSLTGSSGFILPAPKTGLGMATQSVTLDEVGFWQTSSLGDKARMVLGDTIYYGVQEIANRVIGGEDKTYIGGGGIIPNNLSALQYKGMKKRAYNFSFQLFAYDYLDLTSITNFVTAMHSFSMPMAGVGDGGQAKLYAPAVFQPRILGPDMTSEATGWLLEPKPCTILTFNSSAGQYAIQENGRPAVITCSMLLAEIEPVVWDNGVKCQFEIFEDTSED